jgi:hypothetical protein
VAVNAADLVRQASWLLINRQEAPADVENRLRMPALPSKPAQHLSADLCFRFLPYVHRRALAIDPADILADRLGLIFRQWPLSGVLSSVEEGPLCVPSFAGHPGLWMLYGQRLAENEKSAWIPGEEGYEYVDLIWQELGKDQEALRRAAAITSGMKRSQSSE